MIDTTRVVHEIISRFEADNDGTISKNFLHHFLFGGLSIGASDELEIFDFVGLAELLGIAGGAGSILALVGGAVFGDELVFREELVDEVAISSIAALIVVVAVERVLDREEDVFALLLESGREHLHGGDSVARAAVLLLNGLINEVFSGELLREVAQVFSGVALPLLGVVISLSVVGSLREGEPVCCPRGGGGRGAVSVLPSAGVAVHGLDVEVLEGFGDGGDPVLLQVVQTLNDFFVVLEVVVHLDEFGVLRVLKRFLLFPLLTLQDVCLVAHLHEAEWPGGEF